MAEGASGHLGERVPFGLAGKFVSVQRNDEEIPNVFPNSLTVVPPERCDRVEE